MGFLTSLIEKITGTHATVGTGQPAGLMEVITGLLTNPETGGIQGLVNRFKEKGLGDVVSSWISTGSNLPITAEQIQSVLGNEQIQSIAQKLGLSPSDAANRLASALPEAIDKLTPNGELPEGSLLEKGLAMLTGLGKKA
jgi:uncharacterized protein YidB (DUF937 family)